jgi:hypothetical protein
MGELSYGKSLVPARRALEYVRLDHTTVRAAFTDGRPFIDLNFCSGAWHTHHLCGEDRHEIAIFVRSPDVIEERWRVRGPTTAYDAVTMVRRRFLLEPHLASDSEDISARPA